MQKSKASMLIPTAVAGGLAWIGGVLLVATQASIDPVGRHYDAYNRVLTAGLILLLMGAVWIARQTINRSLPGERAARGVVAGFALMLAGNALEFWGALVTGTLTSATAERVGSDEVFWGSSPGFFVFLLGSIIATIALIAMARAARRWGATRSQQWAIGSSGVMHAASCALWAVAPIAAAIPAAVFAFGWLSLATAVERADEPATTQVGSPAQTTARA